MNELHDEFDAWIAAGARDDPPRDVALHASGCEICLGLAASFDALLAIDPGMAPPPPLRAAPLSPLAGAPIRLARSAAAVVAVMLVIGAGAILGANALRPREAASVADPTATPRLAEGVLGAAGGPSDAAAPTASESASASATASLSPSPTSTPRPIAGAPTPNPTMGGGPPPASAIPATPVPTPRPTAAPTSNPPPPTPTPPPPPPPTPTPPPTPSPTPEPTPTPTELPTPSPSPTDTGAASGLIGLITELWPEG